MSTMNQKSVSSLLPDDIEEQLSLAKSKIFTLSEQKKSLDNDIESRIKTKNELDEKISEKSAELTQVTSSIESKNLDFNERERKLNQRESTLDVYANALQEKEKKIKKYMVVFEGMKDIIN